MDHLPATLVSSKALDSTTRQERTRLVREASHTTLVAQTATSMATVPLTEIPRALAQALVRASTVLLAKEAMVALSTRLPLDPEPRVRALAAKLLPLVKYYKGLLWFLCPSFTLRWLLNG
ncbi:hypothetical protein MRX96_008830 [Rhipicephalus microplus]